MGASPLPEISKWYEKLRASDRKRADHAFTKLVEHGNELREPDSKRLDSGLFEFRFKCEGVERRVTYTFDSSRNALTLTTFRKQQQRETKQVQRARLALSKRQRMEDPFADMTKWRPKP